MLKVLKRIIKVYFLKKKLLNISKEDKKIYILLAANYGNIGDIAITIAQKKYIENIYTDRKIVEISTRDIYQYINDIKKKLNKDDIITIIGGGNMGSVYKDFEQKRRYIIKRFKNNKIISFPQSIDFLNNFQGKKELKKSSKTYSMNKKLILFARENKSYRIMKKIFENEVYLVPDIVFSLKNRFAYKNDKQREGVIVCLRKDKEKNTQNDIEEKIIEILKNNNIHNIEIKDTHIGNSYIKNEEREEYLRNILESFASTKVVITDRLHGMIFCALTDTPCIVFDNSNNKISSTYNTWLNKQNMINLISNNDVKQINKIIRELMDVSLPKIEFNFEQKYDEIRLKMGEENGKNKN